MKTKHLTLQPCALIVTALVFILSNNSYSQSNYDGSLMSFSNPISLWYVGGWASTKNDQQLSPEMKNTYMVADSVLKTSNVPWLHVKTPDREGVELLFVRKPNGKVRIFQTLVNKENFLILCSRGVEDPCDCRNDASLYIYLPEQNLLKLVEKAFSLSIKRNLIDDINKYSQLNMSAEEFENICGVLNAIADSK